MKVSYFSIAAILFLLSSVGHGAVTELHVALFPWVPSPEKIKAVVNEAWNVRHPETKLVFEEWDCYESLPPSSLDVFETDAIYLDELVSRNLATPLGVDAVEQADDVLEFALRGSMVDGIVFGIPRYACTPMLYFRKGDLALANAETLDEVLAALGYSSGTSEKPAPGSGLLVSLEGSTTDACLYLDAVADVTDRYDVHPKLPLSTELNEAALSSLRMLSLMAGKAQASYRDPGTDRAKWFAEGSGRAMIGYTERLAFMPPSMHSSLDLRELPLESGKLSASPGRTVNLFFVDTLCVKSTLTGTKRKLAIEFANLAASSEVVIRALLQTVDSTGSPQYLLPARRSVLESAEVLNKAPMYSKLRAVYEREPKAYRMDSSARTWLEGTKKIIRQRILDIPPY